jgi:hypothetical protein
LIFGTGSLFAATVPHPSKNRYIAFISHRRPFINEQNIAKIRVNPLKPEERKQLIKTLDQRRISGTTKESLKSNEISELAEYSAGYPPSAYAAMAIAQKELR